MNRNIVILIAIIVIAVIGVGIFAAFTMTNTAQPQNNISAKGTKLDLKNNNNQLWQQMDIVLENVTFKNGTRGNLYMEVWVQPGQNMTIDLSNLLGYGGEPLPVGTVIRVLTWSSLQNSTGGGTGSFSMTLQGWSNTSAPVNAPNYNISYANMPVGPLTRNVNNNLMYYNTTIEGIDAYTNANYPHDDSYEVLFTELVMTVDPNGNLVITFAVPPTLCSTIAHIISA